MHRAPRLALSARRLGTLDPSLRTRSTVRASPESNFKSWLSAQQCSAPHSAAVYGRPDPLSSRSGESLSYNAPISGPSTITRTLLHSDQRIQRFGQRSPRRASPALSRHFHSSTVLRGPPLVLVMLLKTSASLGVIKTVARVTLSLMPVFLLRKFNIVKWLRRAMRRQDIDEIFPGKRASMIWRLDRLNKLIGTMLLIPGVLLFLTICASLERTPITGRWRLIMLSPSEEEAVANELKGNGWYSTVVEILTSESVGGSTPPRVIPASDWRYQWVEATMRRLEISILATLQTHEYRKAFESDTSFDLPPPPEYPLLPRPRASQAIHWFPLSDNESSPHSPDNTHSHHVSPHTFLGPPYSLMIVENPDRNAFSYGFGADGAGGVVLYTGFLDEVLALNNEASQEPSSSSSLSSPSFFQSLLGTLPSKPQPRGHREPTAEQTSALATLLAHELSHLVLSHHLETLSSGTIFIPIVTGMLVDIARVLLFPLTFMFGPFIGDALADASKLGMGEVSRQSEACTSRKLELEADKVSVRLMSLAGFDPRRAVDFWEDRLNDTWALDADAVGSSGAMPTASFWSPHAPAPPGGVRVSQSHPLGSERVRRLRSELDRWDETREKLRSYADKAKT